MDFKIPVIIRREKYDGSEEIVTLPLHGRNDEMGLLGEENKKSAKKY